MKLFSRFRKATPPAASAGPKGRMSIAAILEQTGTKPTIARCGVSGCGLSFASLGSVHAVSFDEDSFALDCGGYCPKCEHYVCPKHARFSLRPRGADPLLADLPADSKLGTYGVYCARCRTELWSSKEKLVAALEEARQKAHKEAMEQIERIKNADAEASEKLRRVRELDEPSADRVLATSPNVRRYFETVKLEATIDFPTVERERLSLVEALARELSKRELDDLVKRSAEQKAGRMKMGTYQGYLRDLCVRHAIDLNRWPSLKVYVGYVIGADEIDKAALRSELDRLTI